MQLIDPLPYSWKRKVIALLAPKAEKMATNMRDMQDLYGRASINGLHKVNRSMRRIEWKLARPGSERRMKILAARKRDLSNKQRRLADKKLVKLIGGSVIAATSGLGAPLMGIPKKYRKRIGYVLDENTGILYYAETAIGKIKLYT